MSSVKISALPAASTLDGGETVPVVQNGETRRATALQIATFTGALIPSNNLSDVPNDALAAENLSVSFVVADLAAMKALGSRPEAVIVETGQAKGMWQWELGSSTTADDLNVVECSASGTAGRYIRLDSYFSNGTVAAPSLAFASSPGTGLYRPASDQIAMALGGANFLTASSSGLALANSLQVTKNTGTADASGSEFNITMAGDGNTDTTGVLIALNINAGGNVAQGRSVHAPLEVRPAVGETVTLAIGYMNYVRLGLAGSTTGNISLAAGFDTHIANEGSGTIAQAYPVFVRGVDLLDGTGPITTIAGVRVDDQGHATRVTTAAHGLLVNDQTGGATTTAGLTVEVTSGTGKRALNITGTANNMLLGDTVIGVNTTPATTLHVRKSSAGATTFPLFLENTGGGNAGVGIDLDPTANGLGTRTAQIISATTGGGDANLVFKVANGAAPATSLTLTKTLDATFATYFRTGSVTVGNLPAAATAGAGARYWVTDANATLTAGIGAVVVAGGANSVPVVSDGTNWRIG